jgi:lysophospholipase L1-like esterase
MTAAEVAERTEPLVTLLRKARPTTPIVLVEDRTYADAHLVKSKRERNDTSRAALKAAYDKLVAAGVQHLHYIQGEHLLGNDYEGTVDSSHPNDLGFVRQAEAMEKVLRPLVK